MTVRQGICQGGPLDKKVRATDKERLLVPGDASGFYVYRGASGPTAATWVWITRKEKQ